MAIPVRFEALLKHPAPGLRFPPHKFAGTGEYILPVRHRPGPPATPTEIDALRELTSASPAAQAQLLEFYRRYNGVDLCCSPDILNGGEAAALSILPIERWEPETAELLDTDLAWMLEGVEEMYRPGNFLTIGANNSERTRLTLFTAGEYDGEALAGRVYCVAVDPVVGFTEVLAPSFYHLLDGFADDPAAFLKKIGYCHAVPGESGSVYGAVADEYLPDIRGLANVVR